MNKTLIEIKYIVSAKAMETGKKRFSNALERDRFMAGVQYASKQFISYLSAQENDKTKA